MTEHQIDPLGYAAFQYDEVRVRELLEAGQDQDTIQRAFVAACWDKSNLYQIASLHLTSVLTMLHGAGAQVDSPDADGWVALHAAILGEGPNHVAVWQLLYFGADPNIQDEHGNASLHLAIRAGFELAGERDFDPELVRRLFRAGADPTMRNSDGQTALALAQSNLQPWPVSPLDRCINEPLERHIEAEILWRKTRPRLSGLFRDPEMARLHATQQWHLHRAGLAMREFKLRETILLLKDAEEDWAKHHP